MKRLPIDLSTFRKLRELQYVYVDKTKYAYNLITGGQCYFLARPRRFGKSLFVSTLYEILSGNKKLFDDLWIGKSDYSWQPHGVINISLSIIDAQDVTSLKKGLCRELIFIAKKYTISLESERDDAKSMFIELIRALHDKFNRVAILIDEYDYPLLCILDDPKLAIKIRDALRSFFVVIKDLDAYINFVFLTGVSTFSKTGIFSGLNNLNNITLNDNFGDICGCTDEEVDKYLKEYIQEWADKEGTSYPNLRQDIKTWYNGYRFGDNVTPVYNVFSLLNALNIFNLESFWIQSGTPTFLIKEITQEYRNEEFRMFDPENLFLDKTSLGVIDIGSMPLPILLFQTGYLTIDRYDKENKLYKLRLPNLEVKTAYQKMLLNIVAQTDSAKAIELLLKLRTAFIAGDLPSAVAVLKRLFAHVTYHQHNSQEKFYHAILQNIFDLAGIKAQSEYATSHGRIDLVLEFPKKIYIIEVKLNQLAESALEQIETRRYQESFTDSGKSIELVGLAFKRESQNFEITYASKLLD